MNDLLAISQAVVATLAPYLSSLLHAVTGAIAEKASDAAKSKALAIWDHLAHRFSSGSEIHAAATLVSTTPEDPQLREIMTTRLIPLLKADPELRDNLKRILGGDTGIQTILAETGSSIRGVNQEMSGGGTQKIEATGRSIIVNVRQRKE